MVGGVVKVGSTQNLFVEASLYNVTGVVVVTLIETFYALPFFAYAVS